MSHDHDALHALRQQPTEWRRRGLTPPAELSAMVAARLGEPVGGASAGPCYADFFVPPTV